MADNFLTRKVGPLPVWGYALLGVGLFFLYRRSKSAATATGATSNVSATVPEIPTATLTTPGGFTYSGPLGGLSSLIPTGALSSTVGSTSGSGIVGNWGGNPQQQNVNFAPVTTGSTLPQLTTLFYQPTPGTFEPVNPNMYSSLPPSTQLYALPNSNQPFGLQQWGAGGSSTGLVVPAA